VKMKTGSLFAAACELGATINSSDPSVVSALKEFGMKIGAAYQIYDDCVDIAGSERETGKTLGTDLRKGKLTLPVLMLLQSAPAIERERFSALILDDKSDEIGALLKSSTNNGALIASVDLGKELIRKARHELDRLPSNIYTEALSQLGDALRGLLDQFRA
jgi:octaprenyl-diphosphate synthase